MTTNTIGTIELTKQLIPHLTNSCRIIQVSSGLGKLQLHPKKTQEIFSNPDLKEEDILQGAKDFLEAVESKNMENWYFHPYATSKMLLNAWSRFVLK